MLTDPQEAAATTNAVEATPEQKITAWVEQHVGGSVVHCERHARWRAGWYVDVRRGGELLHLYVRGARVEEYPPWPLEHEAGVMTVLEKHGVPVPHIYGVCQDPHCIVMTRAPGRHNLGTAGSDAERRSVLDHLAEIYATMHRIDPGEFTRIGLVMPGTAEEAALGCFEACDAIYRRGKNRPDPLIEFLRRWVRRNVPSNPTRISLIHVDSGQFVFENGRVTAMLDFEYACLGDPMIDLANLQARGTYEPMGDLGPLFRRYASLTGQTFELDRLCYHSTWWLLSTPLIVAPSLTKPHPSAAYYDHVCWYFGAVVGALEALADRKGIELDQALPTVASRPSRWSPVYDVLRARFGSGAAGDAYDRRQGENLVEFARRLDAQHSDLEAEYVRAAGELVGRRLSDWSEADVELEKFVLEAGPEHDERLIRMFYRWVRRQGALFEGLVHMPNLTNRTQPFSEIIA